MYTLFVILVIISSLLEIGLVLVQESKGGGLVSKFDGFSKHVGVRETATLLEKSTWIMGGIIVLLCVICAGMLS